MSANSKIILGIIAALIIGGGLFALSNRNDGSYMTQEKVVPTKEKTDVTMEKREGTATTEEKDSSMTVKVDTMVKAGSYEAYNVAKLSMAATGDVVLFFRAGWCPTCRAVDADIRANLTELPTGLTILDVDYDNSSALKQKYGVTYQHTFVQVDAQGTLIKKWSGSPTLAALIAEVK